MQHKTAEISNRDIPLILAEQCKLQPSKNVAVSEPLNTRTVPAVWKRDSYVTKTSGLPDSTCKRRQTSEYAVIRSTQLPTKVLPELRIYGVPDGNLHSIVLSMGYVLVLWEKFTGNGSNRSQQGDFYEGGRFSYHNHQRSQASGMTTSPFEGGFLH